MPDPETGSTVTIRRTGFTIVELLVALALIVFIMSILAEMFAVASQSFRRLKAVGDMAERLRSARSIIIADLTADHFERKKRLSDPTFWQSGPPKQGFFRIYHNSAPSTTNTAAPYFLEGLDLGNNNMPSYRASDHVLHFTVKLRGNNPTDFFYATVPNSPNQSPLVNWNIPSIQPQTRYQTPPNPPNSATALFTSQWAEVIYFMQATGDVTTGPGPNLPLYALYRQQRLLLPDTTSSRYTDTNNVGQYPEVSMYGTAFNSPDDVTIPYRRFNMTNTGLQAGPYKPLAQLVPASLYQQYAGADVLMTDVISFEVRPYFALSNGTNVVSATTGAAFIPLSDAALTAYQNSNPSFFGATGHYVFDTWSQAPVTSENTVDYTTWATAGTATSIPLYQSNLSLRAIQIVMRVWDYKQLQTRQVTIIQDL